MKEGWRNLKINPCIEAIIIFITNYFIHNIYYNVISKNIKIIYLFNYLVLITITCPFALLLLV